MTLKEKTDTLEKLLGFPVILDASIPVGEIHIKSGGDLVKTLVLQPREAHGYDAEWPEVLYGDVLDADLVY